MTRTEGALALPGGVGNWIKENPGQMAMLVASTVTMIVPSLVSGPILWMLGFGSSGPIFGKKFTIFSAYVVSQFRSAANVRNNIGFLAPAVQSTIGAVRAKSAFAVLQSAAMGGYGTAIVNAVVRSVAGLIPTIWGAIKSWFWGKK